MPCVLVERGRPRGGEGRVACGIPSRPQLPGALSSLERLAAEIGRLPAEVVHLAAAVAARDVRIAEMEKLLEEPRRSRKRQAAPFSRGEPKGDPKTPGRKSGGEHNRNGHRMAPTEPPDRVVEAPLPGCCPECGGDVLCERFDDQYQSDLAQRRTTVTVCKVVLGSCGACGKRIRARHLEQNSDALGAASSQVAPDVRSLGMWLHYVMGLSFGKCASVLGQLGVPVTTGALDSGAQSTGTAHEPVHQEITARVNDAAMASPDESGWKVAGERAWLWVASSTEATAYNIAGGGGYDDALALLNEDYGGVLVRNGYVVYRPFVHATHQSRLAHLLREATEIAAGNPLGARATPLEVRDILKSALGARQGSERQRVEMANACTKRTEGLLDAPERYEPNARLIKHLANEQDALFTFLTHDGVKVTSYRAEQTIRPAVVNQEVSGASRT